MDSIRFQILYSMPVQLKPLYPDPRSYYSVMQFLHSEFHYSNLSHATDLAVCGFLDEIDSRGAEDYHSKSQMYCC